MHVVASSLGSRHGTAELACLDHSGPLCWMVFTNSPLSQLSSLTASYTGTQLPFKHAVACAASGNCVLEWLPHTITFFTSLGITPKRAAICAVARFWSNLVMAEKLHLGMEGAHDDAIRAFVFAGLPTTRTFIDFLATWSRAFPC